jgi:NTP pyrophosphatase (non-canonical NTP hydrolase)
VSELNKPEPAPFASNETPTWDLVIQDMRGRDMAGRAKYGVPLQPNNGRDSLVDAYQEGLDLVVYLRNEIEHRKSNPGPLTFERLQTENLVWAYRNFGPEREKWRRSFMGVVEEVGELSHALLKQEQGIRGTREEHEALAKDAVADIIIFLADLCNRRGWSLQECVETAWAEVQKRVWKTPEVAA